MEIDYYFYFTFALGRFVMFMNKIQYRVHLQGELSHLNVSQIEH